MVCKNCELGRHGGVTHSPATFIPCSYLVLDPSCPQWDSNPHGLLQPFGFKPNMSACSIMRAEYHSSCHALEHFIKRMFLSGNSTHVM